MSFQNIKASGKNQDVCVNLFVHLRNDPSLSDTLDATGDQAEVGFVHGLEVIIRQHRPLHSDLIVRDDFLLELGGLDSVLHAHLQESLHHFSVGKPFTNFGCHLHPQHVS